MKNTLLIYTLTACSVLLSGCLTTTPGPKAASKKIGSEQTIGVVSLLGEEFQGVHVGTTAFQNKSYVSEVPDWKIDDSIVEFANSQFERNSVFSIKRIENDSGVDPDALKLRYRRSEIQKVLASAKDSGVDTLVLFRGTKYDNARFYKPSYGYLQHSMFGNSHGNIYSLFVMEVFDVETGKQIAFRWGYPNGNPETEIEWKASFSEYDESEKVMIRNKVLQHAYRSVQQTLDAVFILR